MVGKAYTGTICSTFLNYNVSGEILQMSQNTGFINFIAKYSNITFAHEVGHNLGAKHDGDENSCGRSGFLMESSLTPPTDGGKKLSDCSVKNIETSLTREQARLCLVMEDIESPLFTILAASLVTIIIIVILFYCLYKRTASPCPLKSDFWRVRKSLSKR